MPKLLPAANPPPTRLYRLFLRMKGGKKKKKKKKEILTCTLAFQMAFLAQRNTQKWHLPINVVNQKCLYLYALSQTDLGWPLPFRTGKGKKITEWEVVRAGWANTGSERNFPSKLSLTTWVALGDSLNLITSQFSSVKWGSRSPQSCCGDQRSKCT